MSMDHPLLDLINAKIEAAEKDGAFDNLSGAGKPLPECADPENALLNRVMKENGAMPEFVELNRELTQLREELQNTHARSKRRLLMKEMSILEAKIDFSRRQFDR